MQDHLEQMPDETLPALYDLDKDISLTKVVPGKKRDAKARTKGKIMVIK